MHLLEEKNGAGRDGVFGSCCHCAHRHVLEKKVQKEEKTLENVDTALFERTGLMSTLLFNSSHKPPRFRHLRLLFLFFLYIIFYKYIYFFNFIFYIYLFLLLLHGPPDESVKNSREGVVVGEFVTFI